MSDRPKDGEITDPTVSTSEAAGAAEPADAGGSPSVHRSATGAGTAATTTATSGRLRADHYRLGFGVSKSLRYHAKRWRFFESLHNFAGATSILSATAAFVTVTSEYAAFGKWFAIIFAVMTAFDLVIGFGRRAAVHAELYQRFSALATSIVAVSVPREIEVRGWQAERVKIEASEPPQLSTLNVICHNEEVEARGLGPEHHRPLSVLDHALAPFVSLRRRYPPEAPVATPQPSGASEMLGKRSSS